MSYQTAHNMEWHLMLLCYSAVVGLAWLLLTLYRVLKSPLRRIPGPLSSNFTRLPLKAAILKGRQLHYIHHLHQQYGPIVRISPDEVSISSLADVREIHRIGSGFFKTEWYQNFTQGRDGVFSMRDPKRHAQRRKLFARPFSKSALRTSWEPIVNDKVDLAISQIQNELARDGVCDILKWSTFLATDVSTHLMFGESVGMLEKGEKNEYIRILEAVSQGSGIMSELPFLKYIFPYVPLQSFRKMFGTDNSLLRYAQSLLAYSRKNSESHRNIFSGMVYESEKDEASLTDIDVAVEAGNLIVAGSDTTAITLTYLISAVLSRPKLRADIELELGTLQEGLEESQLEALPLLNATITETLRLHGAAPGSLPRSVPDGGATFSGYYLPGGVTVSTQSYTFHRDPTLYQNPEEFDPSRWLPGENQASEYARLAMSPFGSGSRSCLGIHLAWMELRLATAKFFLRCRGVNLAPTVTEQSMEPQHYFLIAPVSHQCEIVKA